MIKSIAISSYIADFVAYAIDGVNVDHNNGLVITEIEGLGPVKANLNFTKLATYDGELYNSGNLEGRNIVIKAYYTWCNTIEEARLATYKYFPIKKPLQLRVDTDNRSVYTIGYVESHEPVIFSENCEVSISIRCESSFFRDERGEIEQMFSNVEPLFEFVYENNSLSPVTEISSYEPKRQCHVNYDGDNEQGFTILLHAVGDVKNPIIYNIRTGQSIKIDSEKLRAKTGNYFKEGDDIIINSIQGKKSAKLLREGNYYNILNVLGKDPAWFTLAHGDNIFVYTADYSNEGIATDQNLHIYVRVQPLYDGV